MKNRGVKKGIIYGILILAIVIIGIFIGIKNTGKSNSDQTSNVDKTAEVVVEAQGSIPYDWEYTIADTSIIKFKEIKEDTNEDSEDIMLGGGKEQHYIFEGLKEGTTTIKFELKSFVSTDIAETKEFNVSVGKDLKTTITERN